MSDTIDHESKPSKEIDQQAPKLSSSSSDICGSTASETRTSAVVTQSAKKPEEVSEDSKAGKLPATKEPASGKSGKSDDREIFVPAPPPATNAWTKRMQVQNSPTSGAKKTGGTNITAGTAADRTI